MVQTQWRNNPPLSHKNDATAEKPSCANHQNECFRPNLVNVHRRQHYNESQMHVSTWKLFRGRVASITMLLSKNFFGSKYTYEWMIWCIYIALLLCIAIHPKRFTIMWGGGVSPQPPPVCSIHLDHHTPATGGEEREIEPIKLMGIIRRPWLTRASGENLARTPGLHPYSLRWVSWIFNDHRESGPRFKVSSERRCFFTV